VSFAAITLCVASQRVFIVVSIYFVIDSVRQLLDTPSYSWLDALYFSMNIPGKKNDQTDCFRNEIKRTDSVQFIIIRLRNSVLSSSF
jgi:hypothetical protein